MWWIVPDKETRILTCTACGVQKKRADDQDFAAVGLELTERDASPDESPVGAQTTTEKNSDDDEQLW